MLNEIAASVLLDQSGRIIAANSTWKHLVRDLGGPDGCGVGDLYQEFCASIPQVQDLVKLVLAGQNSFISPAYPCRLSHGQAWYFAMGIAIPTDSERRALILIFAITDIFNSMGINPVEFVPQLAKPRIEALQTGHDGGRELSKRQLEILELIGEGRTNVEIARDIGIAENTVKRHVTEILQRLNLRSRTEAAIYVSERRAR